MSTQSLSLALVMVLLCPSASAQSRLQNTEHPGMYTDIPGGLGASNVKLSVYDLLGREVAVLGDERKPVGRYEFKFDGTGLACGVYVYRLAVGEDVATHKMALVR